MRRKDKQITDKKVLREILSANKICRVAFTDGNIPYIVPMNYGYKDNTIFLHSALEGRKIDLMKANNNVCVEITDSIEIVASEKACGYGTKYRSVICTGTIYIVIDLKQKFEGLELIMKQHTGSSEWVIPENAAAKVAVLRIDIETITGKISGI